MHSVVSAGFDTNVTYISIYFVYHISIFTNFVFSQTSAAYFYISLLLLFIFGILWLVDVVDDNICRPFLQPIALTRQLGIVNSQK